MHSSLPAHSRDAAGATAPSSRECPSYGLGWNDGLVQTKMALMSPRLKLAHAFSDGVERPR